MNTTDPIRHGDLVIWPIERPGDLDKLAHVPGNVLAQGSATGHAHVVDNASGIVQRSEGPLQRVLELTARSGLSHNEHKTAPLEPAFYRLARKRQYDEQNGWEAVSD